MQESSTDSKLSEGSATVKQSVRDPRLKKLEQVTDSKTDSDNAEAEPSAEPKLVEEPTAKPKPEGEPSAVPKLEEEPSVVLKLEEEPSAVNTANIVDKPADKVGFDLEFVPLEKDDDNVNTAPSLAYNRDRPLGKNRYFRKDPKAKIMKSDSDSGSDNKDSSGEVKKRSRGVGHRNYRQRHEPTKENDRHETVNERKRSDKGRGRRRHSGDRPGDHSTDRPGEPTAGHDRPDGRDHHHPGEPPEDAPDRHGVRPGNRLGSRPVEHPVGRRGDRPGEHPNRPGQRDHLGDRAGQRDHLGAGRRPEDHSGRGRPGDLRGERSRGRLPKRPDDRTDIGHRHPLRREHDENMHGGRLDRREEWIRGRGQRRCGTHCTHFNIAVL